MGEDDCSTEVEIAVKMAVAALEASSLLREEFFRIVRNRSGVDEVAVLLDPSDRKDEHQVESDLESDQVGWSV